MAAGSFHRLIKERIENGIYYQAYADSFTKFYSNVLGYFSIKQISLYQVLFVAMETKMQK